MTTIPLFCSRHHQPWARVPTHVQSASIILQVLDADWIWAVNRANSSQHCEHGPCLRKKCNARWNWLPQLGPRSFLVTFQTTNTWSALFVIFLRVVSNKRDDDDAAGDRRLGSWPRPGVNSAEPTRSGEPRTAHPPPSVVFFASYKSHWIYKHEDW